jgi:hypothetical protein
LTKAVLVFLFALAPTAAFAVEAADVKPDLSGSDPHWIEDKVSHCWVGNPNPQNGETVSWSGACSESLASGPGTVTWYRNGQLAARDTGTYKGGVLSGTGKITTAGGMSYEGEFPGRGTFTLSDGRKVPAQAIRELGGYSIEQLPVGTK